MKKYFYINKKTKQIAMMCDGKIEVDKNIFDEKEMTVTKKQVEDIDWSKKSWIKNNKFIIKEQTNKNELSEEVYKDK